MAHRLHGRLIATGHAPCADCSSDVCLPVRDRLCVDSEEDAFSEALAAIDGCSQLDGCSSTARAAPT